MVKRQDTVWAMALHTAAKHKILKAYIGAWVSILGVHPDCGRIIYVDGFSGPGAYENGEAGSPIVVLDEVVRALENPAIKSHESDLAAENERIHVDRKTTRGPKGYPDDSLITFPS